MTNNEKHQWLLTQMFVKGAAEPPRPFILTLDGTKPFEWPDPQKYRMRFECGFPPSFTDDEMTYVLIPSEAEVGIEWLVRDVTKGLGE